MTDGPVERFNDDQVRALIARALEYEARGRSTTAEELHEIAAEVGIVPEAVEAALQEHRRQTSLPAVVHHSRAGLAVAAIGLPLGAAAGAILSVSGPFIGLGVLGLKAAGLVAAGALLLTLGRQPAHRSFQFRNLLLWTGVGVGGIITASVMGGGPVALTGMIVGWSIRGWFTSSVLGSAAVMAVRRITTPNDPKPRSPVQRAFTPARDRLRAIATRLSEWLGRLVTRARSNVAIRALALHEVIARVVRPRSVFA